MFHRATILQVVERHALRRINGSSGRGELHVCGTPLKTISFLDAAANAVATSLKVEFGEQARVLLFTGYERTKSRPIFKAGRIVKLPDKESRFL